MAKQYDVFISYSQRADHRLARNLERGLQQLGRSWNERRALTVFRDASSLSASPDLWESLSERLDQARYAIVLLSPDAATSKWVNREIDHFLADHGDDRLLLALTDGHLEWDETAGDWATDSTAIPESLRARYDGEPLWVDLRWACALEDVGLRDGRFRNMVATLAAPVHGMSKDELEGEDLRAHRRFVRIRRTAVASLMLLLAAAAVTSTLALLFRGQTATERSLRRQVERTNAELDQANTDLTDTNAELDQANTDLADTNAELAQANTDLADSNAELDQANTDLAETNAELDQANTDLAETNAELDQANTDLAETNAELDAANLDLARLEAFASRAAGEAICQGDYALVVAEASNEDFDYRQAESELAAIKNFAADAAADTTLQDSELRDALRSVADWQMSRIDTAPIPSPPDCPTEPGYPFRDRWNELLE
ncbi:MAG: TIR domain-containing protein [Acidimicrobiia bacterium]